MSAAVRSRSRRSISAIRAPTNCWSKSWPPACAPPICMAATPITRRKFPKVFGHEGAGIVRAVGRGVTQFKPGDHVVMAYPWCGECENCQSHRQTYCLHAFDLKMNGTRADGSTLHAKDGKPVYSAFFQQSSFGNFTIANERFAVKVRNDVPLTSVCALACGGQTGAGAVLNVMAPKPGDSFAVFGVGTVGLAAPDGGQDRRLRSDHRGRCARASPEAGARTRRHPHHQSRRPHRRGGRNPEHHRRSAYAIRSRPRRCPPFSAKRSRR